MADIDDTILLSFAIEHVKPAAAPVDGSQAQIGDFLHPQSASQHQHEHGAVTTAFNYIKKPQDLLVFQMLGQWLGQAQLAACFHRVADRYLLFIAQIAVEAPDTFQMTVDRFGLQPFGHQIIDISVDLLIADMLKGNIDPQHKLFELIEIRFKRMVGVVATLQIAAVVDDYVGQVHRFSLLQ